MRGTLRLFVLSPANAAGPRARQLLGRGAGSDLAVRLCSPLGASVGEVFSFISGLYFRGKFEYASAFAHAGPSDSGVYVIVPGRGIRPAEDTITARELRAMGRVPVRATSPRYSEPLARDARALANRLPRQAEVVLLGSIASAKYVPVLTEALHDRLRVPAELIGLGMMQRGALLRRRAEEGRELQYVEVPKPRDDG